MTLTLYRVSNQILRVRSAAKLHTGVSKGHLQRTVGIQRETVNPWESRVPLTPGHVKRLVEQEVKVLIQPSNRRCFTNEQYEQVGAQVEEKLDEAPVILGVKRPVELGDRDLLPNKTYAFFSHTIKAQFHNMTLLDTLLARNIRLLDYETMVDAGNRRLVGFGWFAGVAGAVDILHGLGTRLLGLGHYTPFLKIGMAHNYPNIQKAAEAVKLAGYQVALGGLPPSLGPQTIVVTGTGNVSQGVQSMLDNLPVEYIRPEQLKQACLNGDRRKIYVCVVSSEHHMVHCEGRPYCDEEFMKNPEMYHSEFATKIAPYTSVLITAAYWDHRISRILKREDAKPLVNMAVEGERLPDDPSFPRLPHRLTAISDISADLNGQVEFTDVLTTIDNPFGLYNPNTDKFTEGMLGEGILICSIDNMPTQFAVEASEHFGKVLQPYLSDLIASDATQPFSEVKASDVVKNAFITSNGELTPRFKYIENLRERRRKASGTSQAASEKKVLILGSGYVVPSVVEYLSRDDRIKLSVASHVDTEIQEIVTVQHSISPHLFDVVQDQARLSRLVGEHDLVISMIPWKYHPVVAKACIQERTSLLTSSYCTPELENLAGEFERSGITAFMEIGLDPGIDHLLARSTLDDVIHKGGKVVSYTSFTGGLPAPESSDNPLRYKFSWSPEAALSTVMNGARFLEDGKVTEIPGDGALMNMAHDAKLFPGFNLEVYPNRDSLKYISRYGLETCRTVIRGTLRYKGFCAAASLLVRLGLLSNQPDEYLRSNAQKTTWRQFVCFRLQLPDTATDLQLKNALSAEISDGVTEYDCLKDLGLLDDSPVVKTQTPLSATAAQLEKRLKYGPNERDMIVMSHEVVVQWPETKQQEVRKGALVVYGETGLGRAGMAMSRTVGVPAAIAAKMMLYGDVPYKGIVLPLKPDLYGPILHLLKSEGIEARETSIFTPLES